MILHSFDYLQAEADAKRARIWAASSRRPGSGAQSVADLFTAAITLTAWLARSAASATDLLLHVNVPCAGGSPAYLEIDKLPDGTHRATVGTLFEHQEVCRTRDLEALVRHANTMAGCRSFDDVVDAFRRMRMLG
jgi:hypothetical protein